MANGRGGRSLGKSKKVELFPKKLIGFKIESSMQSGIAALEAAVREKVLRSATLAMSYVMYNEMRQRVPVKEGTLFNAIYQYHVADRSTKFRQIYAIGPNKAKAPHWYVVEYGHWRYNKIINGKAQRSKSDQSRSNRVDPPGGPHKSVHNLPGALDVPVWVPANPYIRTTYSAKIGQISSAFNKQARIKFAEVTKGS